MPAPRPPPSLQPPPRFPPRFKHFPPGPEHTGVIQSSQRRRASLRRSNCCPPDDVPPHYQWRVPPYYLTIYPPPHPNDFSNRPGFVSRHCHCSMTDGVCFITYRVNGWVATDATTERRNGAYGSKSIGRARPPRPSFGSGLVLVTQTMPKKGANSSPRRSVRPVRCAYNRVRFGSSWLRLPQPHSSGRPTL